VIPKGKNIAGPSYSLPKANKEEVLVELMEISKSQGETIRINTKRKASTDNLIKSMNQNKEEAEKDVAVPEYEEDN
jgi:acetylglutamate synthase